jgi:hypothetical protein
MHQNSISTAKPTTEDHYSARKTPPHEVRTKAQRARDRKHHSLEFDSIFWNRDSFSKTCSLTR